MAQQEYYGASYANTREAPSQHHAPPPHFAPQQQQQHQYGPPPGQPCYPPPGQQYGYGQPPMQFAPPSIGYVRGQQAHVDTTQDAQALRSAMKGFGTDDVVLINTLSRIPDPLVMENLKGTFKQMFRRDLLDDVRSETSGYYQEALEALVRGPLMQDVYNLSLAIAGAGTNERLLDDVLIGRTNADLQVIKQTYYEVFHRQLESDVRGDLSMKTQQMYEMVLAANRQDESAPVYPQELERAVTDMHRATQGFTSDQITVCHILTSHSDGQIRAISQEYQRKYKRPLKDVIKDKFSGHMEQALMRMLRCGEDRAMADAERLEDAMAGFGTKDRLLVNRVVRLHWNKDHKNQVRGAYRHRYRRELVDRVKGETSGDYKRLMAALLEN